VAVLWPVHRLFWATRKLPYGAVLRQKLLKVSPVLDYHDSYIQLGPKVLYAWAALDTHDALTDRYKFKRTVEEIILAHGKLRRGTVFTSEQSALSNRSAIWT
jgi:hypothetical protein